MCSEETLMSPQITGPGGLGSDQKQISPGFVINKRITKQVNRATQ